MNINKLNGRMVEMNITNAQLAEALGIDDATLYRKKAGTSDFYRKEIQMIKEVLNLSDDDVRAIFFDQEVACTRN